MSQQVIDPGLYRRVLGCHATGVAVITALADGDEPVGMAVTSFTSVSLDPPLVAFCPDRKSSTWPRIASAGKFAVNLLAEQQGNACRAFATRGADKFAGIDWHRSDHGLPVLAGALASIECTVHDVIEAGDHFIVLGRVLALTADDAAGPLLFFRSTYAQVARS